MILRNMRHYLYNRFIAKTHLSYNHLPKGEYHELHDRILHASFEALVEFIEVEYASHYMAWHDIKQGIVARRHPNYGMNHLEWEMTLEGEQAEKAAEAADLYLWWKEARPARKDPWDDTHNSVEWELAEKEEKAHIKEDQEQLCRLAKLMNSLWT